MPKLTPGARWILNATAELAASHPGYCVVPEHKHAVRKRLSELFGEEGAEPDSTEDLVDPLFLLLEGALTHRGIDGNNHLAHTARRIAENLLKEAPASPRHE